MSGFISLIGFVAFFAGWYFMLSAFRAPYGRKLRALGIGCLSLFLSVPLIGSQGSTTKTTITPKPTTQTRAATKPTKKAVKPAARATAKPLGFVSKPRVIAKPKPRPRVIAIKPKPRALTIAPKPQARAVVRKPRARAVVPKPRAPVRSSRPAYIGTVRCSSFSSWEEAQAYFIAYNVRKLDKNNDGIACESLR